MLGLGFIVAHQATLLDEPVEGAFNDPAPVQDLESLSVLGSLDDVEVQTTPRPQRLDPGHQASGIAGVGPDLGQAPIPPDTAAQQGLGPIPILFVRRAHIDAQEQPKQIHQDVPFASADLLAGVIAADAPLVPELDGLTIHDRRGGTG